jgi:hypothetical protein
MGIGDSRSRWKLGCILLLRHPGRAADYLAAQGSKAGAGGKVIWLD